MFSANQKPFVICTRVTSFALVLPVCTHVTGELHSFPSQSGLSNFFVYIISQQIHREIEYRIDEDFYWTDSKVVLGYLNNESKRFHVFVANRVQEIQDCTDKKQWRYIESKQNPADEASRGMRAKELQDSRWILGPEFLWSRDCT